MLGNGSRLKRFCDTLLSRSGQMTFKAPLHANCVRPEPSGFPVDGIKNRIRRGESTKVALPPSSDRHRGRERVVFGAAQKLVIPEEEHLVLADGTAEADRALVLIERRRP